MKKTPILIKIIIILMINAGFCSKNFAQNQNAVVRIAKLVIDSVQLDSYKLALKEEIEASLRLESGVLTLYAVADKKQPTHITVFEIYANQDAYLSHLETPHFKKYKLGTKAMVKSLELTETTPIAIDGKPK